MGFLADVGRADPVSMIQSYKQKNALLETSKTQLQALRNQLRKQAEEEALNKQPVNLTAHPYFLSLPDDLQKKTLDFFQSQGLVNENGIGERGNILKGVQYIENTTKGMQEFLKPLVEKQRQELIGIQRELAVVKNQPGKEKLAQQLAQKLQEKAQQYNMASVIYDQRYEELQKREQRKFEMQKVLAGKSWAATKEGVKYREREANIRAIISGSGTTSKPTRIQKLYLQFREQNPEYQGDILDFEKLEAMMKTDPRKAAMMAAASDKRVFLGTATAQDVSMEYLKAWQKLTETLKKKKEKKEKGKEVKLTPEQVLKQFPDAYQINGRWLVTRNGKRQEIVAE